MAQLPERPYRVQPCQPGCLQCGANSNWDVVFGSEDAPVSVESFVGHTIFDSEEEAQELVDMLNFAHNRAVGREPVYDDALPGAIHQVEEDREIRSIENESQGS